MHALLLLDLSGPLSAAPAPAPDAPPGEAYREPAAAAGGGDAAWTGAPGRVLASASSDGTVALLRLGPDRAQDTGGRVEEGGAGAGAGEGGWAVLRGHTDRVLCLAAQGAAERGEGEGMRRAERGDEGRGARGAEPARPRTRGAEPCPAAWSGRERGVETREGPSSCAFAS